jgi:hypothetical protein
MEVKDPTVKKKEKKIRKFPPASPWPSMVRFACPFFRPPLFQPPQIRASHFRQWVPFQVSQRGKFLFHFFPCFMVSSSFSPLWFIVGFGAHWWFPCRPAFRHCFARPRFSVIRVFFPSPLSVVAPDILDYDDYIQYLP